jgi:hypothetical protein
MKKIFAAFAAGLMLASAVPALAADTKVDARPGYCWQDVDNQADDGWYCGGRGRGNGHGHRGYCWDDGNTNNR